MIVLSPDVAEFFPDSESVNLALRSIVESRAKRRGSSSDFRGQSGSDDRFPTR